MNRVFRTQLWAVLPLLCILAGCASTPADRPSILWISLEDITPMMGAYGDEYARTPVFDSLASAGIRYDMAYAVSPVCSPSRSSVITGMYPNSLGSMHHRSNTTRPQFSELLPNLLRDAGYYTSNNRKRDYNMGGDNWHESSAEAHWRNRTSDDQPFFSVFNFTECHSSVTKIPEDEIVEQRLSRLKPDDFHDPSEAPIPPYHPDVPLFRRAWARYYDAVTQVDYRAGDLIEELKEDGLWEDTIIFVWADHGVGMPRGKHTAWEQGVHVPLIVRFPAKYQHLAPAAPGSVIDGLVTLMDLGPSALSLAGVDPPDYMHGRPLFRQREGGADSRDYVFGMRDRLDTRSEMVRTVRDQRYRYQRNFYPHLPFKPYEDYEFGAVVVQEWARLAREGKLTGPQELLAMRFKPLEELYDSENDPHQVRNVAGDPEYAEVLERMRGQLHNWMLETRDLGLLDEAEMLELGKAEPSLWDLGQSIENYERILETANLQLEGQSAIPELIARTNDSNSAVRFWAAMGLAVAWQSAGPETVSSVVPALEAALRDESVSVRITAAEGLFNLGRYEEGLPVLIEALDHPSVDARVRAGCVLDSQPPEANDKLQPAIEPLRRTVASFEQQPRFGATNNSFKRALKAISGEETYYRWGPGASGSATNHPSNP